MKEGGSVVITQDRKERNIGIWRRWPSFFFFMLTYIDYQRAFSSKILKFLAFNISKTYFIYYLFCVLEIEVSVMYFLKP